VVKGASLLSQYGFGYKWKREKKTGTFTRTADLHEDQPPQLLSAAWS